MARSATLTATLTAHGIVPCGDNSCWFGSPGGMGTNGGCRCVARGNLTIEEQHEVKQLARKMARAIVASANLRDLDADDAATWRTRALAAESRWHRVAPLIADLNRAALVGASHTELIAAVAEVVAAAEETP